MPQSKKALQLRPFRIIALFLLGAWGLCISCGCANLGDNLWTNRWTNRLTLPSQNTLVREQLVIHSDFELAAHHRLFDELTTLRTDICHQLGLPTSDEPIHVYLFENQERFEGFVRLHHPEFPARRAFFLETDSRLAVYAQWGDRMAEDLRHEVTHGYLHSVVPGLPLWLDEGLAKYYEVPRGRHGLNRQLFERLLVKVQVEHWKPNLERLEQFSPTQDMTQDDYVEAWAWVHFLLESKPDHEALLRDFFVNLRQEEAPQPISVRLAKVVESPESALLAHIGSLVEGKGPKENKAKIAEKEPEGGGWQPGKQEN
jgi:hypothetical protein